MALPILIPLLKIAGGAVVVSGIFSISDLMKNTGNAAEDLGNAAKKSEGFLDRVLVLSAIFSAAYISGMAFGAVK